MSGLSLPETRSSRISKLTRNSCDPAIDTTPLGSTSVIVAATRKVSFSLRRTEPCPDVCVPELKSIASAREAPTGRLS